MDFRNSSFAEEENAARRHASHRELRTTATSLNSEVGNKPSFPTFQIMTEPSVKSSKFSAFVMPIIHRRIRTVGVTEHGGRKNGQDTPLALAGHGRIRTHFGRAHGLPDLGDRGRRHAAFGTLLGTPGSIYSAIAGVPPSAGIDLDGSGRRHRRSGRGRRSAGPIPGAATAAAAGSLIDFHRLQVEKRRARCREAPLSAFRFLCISILYLLSVNSLRQASACSGFPQAS